MRVRCCRLVLLVGALTGLVHCGGPPQERISLSVTILTPESRGDTIPALPSDRSARLSRDASVLEPVIRVLSRVMVAAHRWGYARLTQHWAVAVFEEEGIQSVRVQPDGLIAVYSGIFRLAETEAGLAALVSHELAHLLAHHTADGSQSSTETGKAELFSRVQEMEADAIGMVVMADAGYDPREMLRIWERMKRWNAPDDELLTHVTYDRRLQELRNRLPDAFRRYVRSNRAPQRKLPFK